MIVTNKTEYLLRIRDITSQFAYVDLMWNTLKSMMVMVQPSLLASGDKNSTNKKNIQHEQRLNVFLCAHSFNEWLRVLYMFYSTTVRYLREYEAGKATDIRSFLLVMLHRIDHSYRPEIARYMPVLQTVLASSFVSPSPSTASSAIHQKYNAGHAVDIYDTIVMDADMLEIAFVEIRQLCHALYKDELKTDPTLEWQDVQVNLPVKSTHTRFESYTYV